ncbi:uncharacterized protein LOC103723050 [Phoenix dactylifera]|uniref:Choline transporter-like protein n=1 Tax=Phoenix dactylifera TaxID=42345 RepID=A0A8B7D3J7_PHODC|nr:uncharacterized protein LOC103723050 [Phoenix dactylifera]
MAKQGHNNTHNDSVRIPIGERRQHREDGRSDTTTAAFATRINQIAPTATQVDRARVNQGAANANFTGKLAMILFLTHLLALAILITFLSVRGFMDRAPAFHPIYWYVPLFTSSASSALTALLWLLLTLRHPSKALKASLWLSPFLTCAVAMLLLANGTGSSLACAALALALALIQSLYACWVTPRLPHAYQILSAATPAVQPSVAIAKYIAAMLLTGLAYSSFWILGVGGVAADRASRFGPLYVLMLLLSLWWSMQVMRYLVHVAVARVAYMKLARGAEEAFRGATGARWLGGVCLGAAVAPVVGAVRGSARAMGLVAGDSDEFLFSCTSCYMGVADRLVAWGNRWGLVHVGAHDKGFGRASTETWEMFVKQGMRRLIDRDLTGSFCFLCGVAGGAAAALVAGCWALAVESSYVTGITLYAFIIGYFMIRIAMAWPQACVAAYHVAYAENPQNSRLGSLIPNRIGELQSSLD